jgi:hypothetical protein
MVFEAIVRAECGTRRITPKAATSYAAKPVVIPVGFEPTAPRLKVT